MTGPNPTDRGNKIGTERHILTDQRGIPLSVTITSANTYDMKAAKDMLDNLIVKRPSWYLYLLVVPRFALITKRDSYINLVFYTR